MIKIDDVIEKAIWKFFRFEGLGWVDIRLNYALITLERMMSTASDRGKFKVLASHKIENSDKCYIDYQDGFPRYYFNFDCMIKETRSWIDARSQLEIEDIILVYPNKREDIGEFIKSVKNQADIYNDRTI